MKDLILGRRLGLWAGAQSIHRILMLYSSSDQVVQRMKPRLLTKDGISFGDCGLVFSDLAFKKILMGNFAWPNQKMFLRNPMIAVVCLIQLLKVKSLYRNATESRDIGLLLAASIEAILTYANHHESCKKLLSSDQNSTIKIGTLSSTILYLIYFDCNCNWTLMKANKNQSASCSLEFKDDNCAKLAALGNLDQWLAVTDGSIVIKGKISIIEKFGYIARIVQREVPKPCYD